MSVSRPASGWLRIGGAILLLVVAGCAAADTSSPSTTLPSSVGASHAPSPATPAELLAAALAPLRVASQFETTITVDGAVAVSSSGRSYRGSSRLTVTTGGRTVEYIHVPPRAWARQAGGSWSEVATDQAQANPLDVLASPARLEVAADGGGATVLRAAYDAAALGLAGDQVVVEITLDGASLTFRYETDAGGHPTISSTIIGPATQLDRIVPPTS